MKQVERERQQIGKGIACRERGSPECVSGCKERCGIFFLSPRKKKERKGGEYLLDTMTLSFMHGREGPSSTDRAVERERKTGERGTQLMCSLESIKGKTIINAQKDKKGQNDSQDFDPTEREGKKNKERQNDCSISTGLKHKTRANTELLHIWVCIMQFWSSLVENMTDNMFNFFFFLSFASSCKINKSRIQLKPFQIWINTREIT